MSGSPLQWCSLMLQRRSQSQKRRLRQDWDSGEKLFWYWMASPAHRIQSLLPVVTWLWRTLEWTLKSTQVFIMFSSEHCSNSIQNPHLHAVFMFRVWAPVVLGSSGCGPALTSSLTSQTCCVWDDASELQSIAPSSDQGVYSLTAWQTKCPPGSHSCLSSASPELTLCCRIAHKLHSPWQMRVIMSLRALGAN